MFHDGRRYFALTLAGVVVICTSHLAMGQIQDRRLQGDANLIVNGRVDNVFQSAAAENEYLVQILVQRSEVRNLDEGIGNTRFPAPGEYVYVHVDGRGDSLARATRRSGPRMLPNLRMHVRAYLSTGLRHRWEGSAPGWFEATSGSAEHDDPVAGRTRPGISESDVRSLGISSERVSIGLGTALKVTRVEPGSPAANAGIEVDDVLTKANGASLTSPAELATAYRSTRGTLTLTVRDVRTGRDVLVDIQPGVVRRDSNVTATPSRKRLGVTTELAFYEGAAVVKVTEVERQSPAQRAGIVPGLLILTANGNPISDSNKLVAAERSATRTLRLEVVDPRDRRKRVVHVEL